MTDRPILFSAPMVRALLDGTKTQTRRLLRSPEHWGCPTGDCPHNLQTECNESMASLRDEITNYRVGDRLWVKETHTVGFDYDDDDKPIGDEPHVIYAATECPRWYDTDTDEWLDAPKWTPSIFMRRKASRLTLTVTDVRIERLQDCSRGDAMEEGCPFSNMADGPNPVDWYRDLWNDINGAGAWEQNPWIVAISFTVERRNIDR